MILRRLPMQDKVKQASREWSCSINTNKAFNPKCPDMSENYWSKMSNLSISRESSSQPNSFCSGFVWIRWTSAAKASTLLLTRKGTICVHETSSSDANASVTTSSETMTTQLAFRVMLLPHRTWYVEMYMNRKIKRDFFFRIWERNVEWDG